jgi:hypothetical protein
LGNRRIFSLLPGFRHISIQYVVSLLWVQPPPPDAFYTLLDIHFAWKWNKMPKLGYYAVLWLISILVSSKLVTVTPSFHGGTSKPAFYLWRADRHGSFQQHPLMHVGGSLRLEPLTLAEAFVAAFGVCARIELFGLFTLPPGQMKTFQRPQPV